MAVDCQKFIESAFSTSVDAGSYLGEAAAEPRSGACCLSLPRTRDAQHALPVDHPRPVSCSVPLAFAAGADGLEARVSTPIAAQPLARALEQLSRSSGVQFLYSGSSEVHMAGAVPRGATVKQALDALLAGTGLGYTVVDGNVIAIDPAPVSNAPKPAAPKPREAEAVVAPTLTPSR